MICRTVPVFLGRTASTRQAFCRGKKWATIESLPLLCFDLPISVFLQVCQKWILSSKLTVWHRAPFCPVINTAGGALILTQHTLNSNILREAPAYILGCIYWTNGTMHQQSLVKELTECLVPIGEVLLHVVECSTLPTALLVKLLVWEVWFCSSHLQKTWYLRSREKHSPCKEDWNTAFRARLLFFPTLCIRKLHFLRHNFPCSGT